MRVAFVSQWFPPENGAVVPWNIATGLAQLGHEVDVLTAFPNYPSGVIQDGWKQRPYTRERILPNVTVHRSPVYPSHDANPVRRMATYLSHAMSATTMSANRIPRPDVWLIYSSPATAALPAQLARPGRRAPTCLLIQDLWPDSVSGSDMVDGAAARLTQKGLTTYVNASYRQAARIGVISPGMTRMLRDRGVPGEKIEWTPNWMPDETAPAMVARSMLRLPEQGRLFLYAGNLGGLQGLDGLVDAFEKVPEATLVLMGDGIERIELERRAARIPNVHVLPAVDQSSVAEYLAAADVLVVSLKDTALLRVTMPSKMQVSLRAGRPVLVHAAGDAAELVLAAGAGAAAAPGDAAATNAAISRLTTATNSQLAAMGTAARTCYEKNFTPEVGARRLETMLVNAQKDGRP